MEITKVCQTASSWILIYPVIPLTYRFLNHPSSKLRRIGRPRTTLRGIYIISEIIHRFSPSSIMIPASHPPVARPLALRSAFNRAPPSFWRLRRGDRSDYEPMLSLFRRFRQRPGELIARSPSNSHSKTTAAARGTVRWNEYAGEDIWKAWSGTMAGMPAEATAAVRGTIFRCSGALYGRTIEQTGGREGLELFRGGNLAGASSSGLHA